MKKKSFALSIIFFQILLWVIVATVSAQIKPDSLKTVPSDLALDLQFAQKNPSPESEVINQTESKRAVVVTTTAQQTVKLEEALATELRTQPADQTEHPDQSTSEQVIVLPNPGELLIQSPNPSETMQPFSSQINVPSETESQPNTNSNIIPGTTVKEPDDNAAPVEPNNPKPSNPGDNSQSPASDQTSPDTIQILPDDNSAGVQGIATKLNWWQRLIYKIFK